MYGMKAKRSVIWVAVLAALVSGLLTSVATAQSGDGSPEDESDSDRAERIAEAFETVGTDRETTTIASPDRFGTLQIDARVQGNGLDDLPLVDSVYLGYRCAGGPTTLLYVWIDTFDIIGWNPGTGDGDAFAHIRTTLVVEPGVCGVWIARGADSGAFVSGTGLYDVATGETTIVNLTGRAGTGFTCRGLPATIVGTNGDDVLSGTSGADVIVADFGNDFVRGRGGDDVICGGGGDDLLWGNTGEDRMFGGAGDDIVRGGRGTDVVLGGAGFDIGDGGLGTNMCNTEFERRC